MAKYTKPNYSEQWALGLMVVLQIELLAILMNLESEKKPFIQPTSHHQQHHLPCNLPKKHK